MKQKWTFWLVALLAVFAVAVVMLISTSRGVDEEAAEQEMSVGGRASRAVQASQREVRKKAGGDDEWPSQEMQAGDSDDGGQEASGEDGEAAMTEEEKRQAEDEKRVDEFDALTDKWMEPCDNGVTMADVDAFAAQFRKVPQNRKEECLQRALNLVPDENVMLLAGILMDKSHDKELLELVYNDVLNRDEDVKRPILQQIFLDKEHPCWADTAWILDATGEVPQKK